MGAEESIRSGKTSLGIEFGSTNIKAVLTDLTGKVLATGSYGWENRCVDGIWTYPLVEIEEGLRGCYQALRENVEKRFCLRPATYGVIGISAMMHGILALSSDGRLLAPFQTWRNTNTQKAADILTEKFKFNIPLRWTVAHVYQLMLEEAPYLDECACAATLASYIHERLTGQRVTGIGDASGIFPIDEKTGDYDQTMLDTFEAMTGRDLKRLFPKVLAAGEAAGKLTPQGAALLDETGTLQPGVPFCPPEGDAGTGMVATNAVEPHTGNVSAGTSTFAMIVLDRRLSRVYREIDMVTTPDGSPVAMAHANNGTSDINAWTGLFGEFAKMLGVSVDDGQLFTMLFEKSLAGAPDAGGLVDIGFYSGEGMLLLPEGVPLFVRRSGDLNLADFYRAHIYGALAVVRIGLELLLKDEKIPLTRLTGHGGLFKTPGVAQRYLAAAAGTPVTVLETAGEGGPWGEALLGLYFLAKQGGSQETLGAFLDNHIFRDMKQSTVAATAEEIAGFDAYMKEYRAALEVERLAAQKLGG